MATRNAADFTRYSSAQVLASRLACWSQKKQQYFDEINGFFMAFTMDSTMEKQYYLQPWGLANNVTILVHTYYRVVVYDNNS